jgi:hypothetical protein
MGGDIKYKKDNYILAINFSAKDLGRGLLSLFLRGNKFKKFFISK